MGAQEETKISMRAIISVATGSYVRGLDRLTEWCALNGVDYVTFRDRLPEGSPTHQDVPYAFKAHALAAASTACDTLLWCDSSVVPIRSLDPLWERIERDGYWIANNGWTNYEWTADSAYPDLFPELFRRQRYGPIGPPSSWEEKRASDEWQIRDENKRIPHVVATTFGISLAHPTGRAIFEEYYRLASKTKAFCGPWTNDNYRIEPCDHAEWKGERNAPCGPSDVRGHRHDQTALSVIAWRLGCQLTSCPDIFAYHDPKKEPDERTILLAKGI